MDLIGDVVAWFTNAGNWSGSLGIGRRVYEHVTMSLLATALACVVALPVGLLIGHTGRGAFAAISLGNLGRALPSFGILALVFPFTLRYLPGEIGFWATLVALVLLGIPPILTNSYVAIDQVDRDAKEAATAMGMSGTQVLRMVEVPLGAPLIVAGIRTAAAGIVATATLGAVFGWGGLGRFIVDGMSVGELGRDQLVGGALLVALLAILTEVAFGRLERAVTRRWRGIPHRDLEPLPLAPHI